MTEGGGGNRDLVANVLFVRQDLMDRTLSPGPPQICGNAAIVQHLGELRFNHSFIDEHTIHPTDDLHFVLWPWNENDAVCLNAFLLPPAEDSLGLAAHVAQHPTKPKPW